MPAQWKTKTGLGRNVIIVEEYQALLLFLSRSIECPTIGKVSFNLYKWDKTLQELNTVIIVNH